MKRGDHIFANGLSQTIDELAAKAAAELGSSRDGRILVETFKSCRKILDEPPFHLTVDKDIVAPFGDTHSVVFGMETQAFKNNMISYIFAIKGRNEQPPTPQNVEFFHHAIRETALWIKLHIDSWISLACDPDAERLMPEKRKEIARGKASLQNFKALILQVINTL
ncbi:MAG: hypothetical protein JO170_23380 [Verrucomicrobia bacterium]|nr:hypothetical protein [Verrucomicrobiota bacterium]